MRFSLLFSALILLAVSLFTASPVFASCSGGTAGNNPNGSCVIGQPCNANETNVGTCKSQDTDNMGSCCVAAAISDVCNAPAISTPGTCKKECGTGEQPWSSCNLPPDGAQTGQCCIANSVTSCEGTDNGVKVTGFCMKSCDAEKDINVGSCTGGVCCYPKSHKEQAEAEGKAGYFATYGYVPPLGQLTIPQIVARFIAQVLPLIGALFFLMFLWGGFQWFTAGGDGKKVGNARSTLVNATVGISIVIFAYALVSYLISVFAAGLGG